MKAFLVGGTNSGSGKTTVTLGLLRAYARRELRVQPYKVGPDYIDTGWHSAVTGIASRNLDAFMLSENAIQRVFHHHAAKADLGIIALFEQWRQRLRRALDAAGQNGCRADQQGADAADADTADDALHDVLPESGSYLNLSFQTVARAPVASIDAPA